jgi:hypothetical protein
MGKNIYQCLHPVDQKTCTQCGILKPLTDFYKRKNRPSGHVSECKSCIIARNRARYEGSREEINDKRAAKVYGLTYEEVVEMRESSNGICQCCNRPGLHHHKRLVIDHDHSTGKVRGLICSRCNSILGFAQDDLQTLKNLIAYLEK